MAGVEVTTLVMTGEVHITFHNHRAPRYFGEVANTFQENGLFCILFATGRLQKYPITNIFEIIEDWDLKEK